jgi:hypothetical protein
MPFSFCPKRNSVTPKASQAICIVFVDRHGPLQNCVGILIPFFTVIGPPQISKAILVGGILANHIQGRSPPYPCLRPVP